MALEAWQLFVKQGPKKAARLSALVEGSVATDGRGMTAADAAALCSGLSDAQYLAGALVWGGEGLNLPREGLVSNGPGHVPEWLGRGRPPRAYWWLLNAVAGLAGNEGWVIRPRGRPILQRITELALIEARYGPQIPIGTVKRRTRTVFDCVLASKCQDPQTQCVAMCGRQVAELVHVGGVEYRKIDQAFREWFVGLSFRAHGGLWRRRYDAAQDLIWSQLLQAASIISKNDGRRG